MIQFFSTWSIFPNTFIVDLKSLDILFQTLNLTVRFSHKFNAYELDWYIQFLHKAYFLLIVYSCLFVNNFGAGYIISIPENYV